MSAQLQIGIVLCPRVSHLAFTGPLQVFSSVPALMNARSGMASTWDTIGEPHFPQNRRSTGSPLSPTSSKVLSVWPAIVRLSFGTATITENDVPLCFWQCGQWQTAAAAARRCRCT